MFFRSVATAYLNHHLDKIYIIAGGEQHNKRTEQRLNP